MYAGSSRKLPSYKIFNAEMLQVDRIKVTRLFYLVQTNKTTKIKLNKKRTKQYCMLNYLNLGNLQKSHSKCSWWNLNIPLIYHTVSTLYEEKKIATEKKIICELKTTFSTGEF